jgi:hypothetical protein
MTRGLIDSGKPMKGTLMAWGMVVQDAPASAVKIPLNEIPADVSESVEEVYNGLAVTQRAVVPFDSETERDQARVYIRAYCQTRKGGRIKASLWSGFQDEASGKFVAAIPKKGDGTYKPALSMAFGEYTEADAAE